MSLLHGTLLPDGGTEGEAMSLSGLLADTRFSVDLPVSQLGFTQH